MNRFAIILLVILLFSFFLIFNMNNRINSLQSQNQILKDSLIGNLKATKDKDKRNEKELKELRRHLAELNSLSCEWRNNPLPADVIDFLHNYTKDRNSPISTPPTK